MDGCRSMIPFRLGCSFRRHSRVPEPVCLMSIVPRHFENHASAQQPMMAKPSADWIGHEHSAFNLALDTEKYL